MKFGVVLFVVSFIILTPSSLSVMKYLEDDDIARIKSMAPLCKSFEELDRVVVEHGGDPSEYSRAGIKLYCPNLM